MLEKRGLEEIGDNKLENNSTGKLMVTVKNKGRRRILFNYLNLDLNFLP